MCAADYDAFIAEKQQLAGDHGFEPTVLPDWLYDFQRELVTWATRKGRAAIFADCGTGKTVQLLVWAQNVHQQTGRPILIATPLAVGAQICAEGQRFGIEAVVSRDGKVTAPLTVTNYERLHLFDSAQFGGMVCDESSAIKCFEGRRRALVTDFMRKMPYRLLCTATAAPNDYVELGTSSEALGALGYMDMLSRFFTNKERTSRSMGGRWRPRGGAQWRFRGYAEQDFWRWVASWARAMRKPSDLGFDDGPFVLPPLLTREHIIAARTPRDDTLFDLPAQGLTEQREEARRTLPERCERVAELLAGDKVAVAWCHLNDEGNLLTDLIDGAVQVSGADSIERKEDVLTAFGRGEIRVLVIKPKIGAWGLNWQHCNHMTWFPSHSYESHYQAVRRSWRFGQTKPVTVDIVTTEGGLDVLRNLRRKARSADRMFEMLVAHMNEAVATDRDERFDAAMQAPAWL